MYQSSDKALKESDFNALAPYGYKFLLEFLSQCANKIVFAEQIYQTIICSEIFTENEKLHLIKILLEKQANNFENDIQNKNLKYKTFQSICRIRNMLTDYFDSLKHINYVLKIEKNIGKSLQKIQSQTRNMS